MSTSKPISSPVQDGKASFSSEGVSPMPGKAKIDPLSPDERAKHDQCMEMEMAAFSSPGCGRAFDKHELWKSQDLKYNTNIHEVLPMRAREQITERGFLTPGEVERIKVWNTAAENGMLLSVEDGLLESFSRTGIFPPPFSPMDAIYSVPMKGTATDKHGVEDTVEEEDQFVVVMRDEGAADKEEDDIVIVEKVQVAEGFVKVEKLPRSV